MSFRYRLLYRLGITPWERDEVPAQLKAVAEEWSEPGRALDLGCGTGRDAVYLASQGWSVTGVDGVTQALEEARQRGAAAGVEVDWLQGDVTRLQDLGVRGGFDLVLDRGCFHGLSDGDRDACAAGVNALAAPDASLLMFAFAPGFHGPAPRGISAEQLLARFGTSWKLVSTERDAAAKLPPWMRNADPSWHRLRRSG